MDRSMIARAAERIANAKALLITAGAGMGVDSGLPDFRGAEGFWKAYPAYAALQLDFASLANPRWFRSDPALAWGFYGHRLSLYRATEPHRGFQVLRRWAASMPHGAFVFTSNVDGHFQRAGFEPERVYEVHGAIDWLQCTHYCGAGVFSAEPFKVDVDADTLRARSPLPTCPRCGALARPNILMFNDGEWDYTRSGVQEARLYSWLREAVEGPLVVVECGAGQAIPTVRRFSEEMVHSHGATLIRINPREPEAPQGQLSLAAGSLEAIQAIDEVLRSR